MVMHATRTSMAQQTSTAMDALTENENVEAVDVSSTDSEWTHVVYVYGEARTAGPALDPVQAWAAHHQDVRAELHGDTENSTAYHVEA
ncbi:hypothetical protein M201_gp79 [Haloarcula californiae tailed virus 2]|uniref:Uncharacterized protein n=1 Tax=Haloarcula californiae tailed virus 2 TaxID=1273747 RepID=R4TA78_9CAUD|nr:hypothetical protein M201_gp79 [Haloarcula californiae tailed virus 2]AGM11845.1 hypothetical protein HCTV2_78 [Haloarcula californiae tailed virus 2]